VSVENCESVKVESRENRESRVEKYGARVISEEGPIITCSYHKKKNDGV